MSRIGTTDFLIEVAKNNVTGHEGRTNLYLNESVQSGAFQNIWGAGTTPYIRPTTGETWEIVSDSAQDDPTGTGAGFVLVASLDTSFNQQSQVVELNGTTPVTLTGTHFRPDLVLVVPPVGTAKANVGTLTLRSNPGGLTRNVVPPTLGSSRDSIFTVPAGKTALSMLITFTFPKNEDGEISVMLQGPEEDDPFFNFGQFPGYQDKTQFEYQIHPITPEKTDIIGMVRSSNNNVYFNFVTELLIVDNHQFGT